MAGAYQYPTTSVFTASRFGCDRLILATNLALNSTGANLPANLAANLNANRLQIRSHLKPFWPLFAGNFPRNF